MNLTLVATQVLNGVATGMLYALMGIGLSLITGILNIPNFAHGAMFAIGAYLLATAIQGLGDFWLALILSMPRDTRSLVCLPGCQSLIFPVRGALLPLRAL